MSHYPIKAYANPELTIGVWITNDGQVYTATRESPDHKWNQPVDLTEERTVTTYAATPSDAPEPAEEPAKPIEGDTPLPLDDPADDDENNGG